MIAALGTRTLVFVHLPKTAGTSVADLLGTRFSPASTLALRGMPDATVDALLADRGRYQFIHGHLPYDIRRSFTTTPFMFTIVRNPIERAISAYSYLRQRSTMAAGEPSVSQSRDTAVSLAGRLSLADFARTDLAARHTGNRQVLMMSEAYHPHYFDRRTDTTAALTQHDLDRACEHLAECDSFGLTEQLDTTVELLSYALGTELLGTVGRANATAGRTATDELDADTLDVLREHTQLDHALYRSASELLELRRRDMLRDLLSQRAASGSSAGRPPPTDCTFDDAIPGDGWYAPERAGDGYMSWTGPAATSWLGLSAPVHAGNIELEVRVVHALIHEQLHDVALLVNGHRLSPQVVALPDSHQLSAPVPHWMLRPVGEPNRVEIVVPFVVRPCDVSATNLDSRSLGLAISRVALVAVE